MSETTIGQPVPAVGQPMSRVDGPLKVTGRATYAAEHNVPGLVYGVIVNSTVSRGTVTAIKSDAALSAPGVLRLLSDWSKVQLAYPTNQVNFFGQPVAVVVATTLEQAEHAASLVEVTYAPAPALTDIDDPRAVSQPSQRSPDYSRGDPDGALRAAHTVVDQNYSITRENHNPMELPSTIAQWDGDRLTLWDKTQWVQGTANTVATALGVPAANVRVISPFVGGAFGSAGMTWQHQTLTAFVAREMGRPVKLVLNRRQMYVGIGYRPSSW
ncbi:MAG TPA: molybdopterin cofactor-binding domain-containing protein, partial [Pseudonocardia sp.]|uniref:xanthine dehydrogenase family protein molybdopterin-binding subunit n=1 Tax=Pseudonocardia sp. TaxID=60912 RepID=UPI002C6D3231